MMHVENASDATIQLNCVTYTGYTHLFIKKYRKSMQCVSFFSA